MPKNKSSGSFIVLLCAFVIGVIAMGGTVAALNETDKSAFCGSCHGMSEAVYTHSISPHASLACNDCHTPHNLVNKLPFKAMAGARDVYYNTMSELPDVFHARQDTKDAIQANCLRCHANTNMNVYLDAKKYCIDCHRAVPHMNKLPISQRKAADV